MIGLIMYNIIFGVVFFIEIRIAQIAIIELFANNDEESNEADERNWLENKRPNHN